eukprot:CAMPEP_0197320790 /NCGR_PEP_ID=MMETSP0891-20130614/61707_1 /TAXON_ID=44058 ORGANISM="Aureoumbra lagunensis, Strain CCMP1510" /NCGR_SAMPLE_ID=MMETSP0891 /ASSEMBLY_ACC=CAM_ASM_000534 /LENGTH=576 /DNA_ID=CAMNT_0042812341 /DNA_START=1 /DNA_END=1731 /DNA_ORIENTATION=+
MNELFGDDETEIRINEKFAKELEAREEKRLKMKEAALGLDETESDEEDSESEDEDAEELTDEIDLQIVKTINAIRRKDAKIYETDTKFFASMDDDNTRNDDNTKNASAKEKKMEYKAVVREQMLSSDRDDTSKSRFAYDEEQEDLRKSVAQSLENIQKDDDDFIVPSKKKVHDNKIALELEQELKDFVASDSKEDDIFLADYVAKRKWVDDAEKQTNQDNDDDSDYEDVEAFEAAYNFRFEQGDTSIITHARPNTIKNSLRRDETTKRKEKRQTKKEDRDLLEKQRLEELRRINNRRRKELLAQENLLRKEAGLSENVDDTILFDDNDFDPEQHDQRMARLFDDEYYIQASEEKKPVFLDEEKEMEALTKMALRGKISLSTDDQDEEITFLRHSKEEDTGITKKSSSKKEKMPFRYKQVEPNDFGLSTDEILQADDRALRQLVSIKKIAPYRDTEYKVKADKRKKWRQEYMKKKKRPRSEDEEKNIVPAANNGENISTNEIHSKKKKKRKKSRNGDLPPAGKEETGKEETANETSIITKKKKKNKHSNDDQSSADHATSGELPAISKSRLSSYGFL